MIKIAPSEVQTQVLQGAIESYVIGMVSDETIQKMLAHMYRRGYVIASYRVPGPPDPPYVPNRPKEYA